LSLTLEMASGVFYLSQPSGLSLMQRAAASSSLPKKRL